MRNITVLLACLLVSLLSLNPVLSIWCNATYSFKQSINFTNQVDSVLTNFPTHLSWNTSSLYNANKIQNDCDDIEFFNETNCSVIPKLFEICNITTGNSTIWLSLNYNPLGTSEVFAYYNSSGASNTQTSNVFDSNYIGRWCMNNTISYDTKGTANGYNSSTTVAVNYTHGKFGYATTYTGGYTWFGDVSQFDFGTSTDFTIEGWLKSNNTIAAAEEVVAKCYNTPCYRTRISATTGFLNARAEQDGSHYSNVDLTEPYLPNEQWHYFLASFNRTGNLCAYVDGKAPVCGSMAAVGNLDNTNAFAFAAQVSNTNTTDKIFKGTLDEIRLSNVVRTSGYANASYQGMIVTFGGEEIPTTTTTTTSTTTTTLPYEDCAACCLDNGFDTGDCSDTMTCSELGGNVTICSDPYCLEPPENFCCCYDIPTTTTTSLTTTTTECPNCWGNTTKYSCCGTDQLQKNVTYFIGNSTVNYSYSEIDLTWCQYGCYNNTIFGTRCNWSPTLNNLLIVGFFILILFLFFLFWKLLRRVF